MFQRLQLLTRLIGVYLRPQQGMALLERVQASTVSHEDRDLVSHIIRAMLRLPAEAMQEPSSPEGPMPTRPSPQRHATRQRHSS